MSEYDDVIQLLKSLSGRANVIPIPRLYITVCKGNYRAAAVLNECIFWSGKYADEEGWFYKSFPQWRRELGIPQHGIERVIKFLSPLVERKAVGEGTPIYYRANLSAVYAAVKQATLAEPARVIPKRIRLGDPSRKRQASIQPITQRGEGAHAPAPTLVGQLEERLKINLNGDEGKLSAALKRYSPSVADANRFADWWETRHDFGKRGQPPSLKQIIQFWPQAFAETKVTKLKGVRHDD